MLYVFHGTDTKTSVEKAHALVNSLRAKRPDASFQKIEADVWDRTIVESHLGGQGLFSSKYIVLLDRVTENADAKELLAELVPAMQESTNIFIVLEGKLNAELKRAVEKSAEKAVVCDIKAVDAAEKADGFNIFGIAGALASKDAFKAWKMYREAIDSGTAVENILGILFWKAKSIADKNLAKELIVMYHEGHRGRRDLELATERLLLDCAKPRM
jgi:DNA polymerase III delta subunit